MDEWKGRIGELDKSHHRDFKKTTAEIKKRNTDTLRLRKRVRKGESGVQGALESTQQEVNDRFLVLLEGERRYVRAAMLQQRAQFAHFVACFAPVLDSELGLLGEMESMEEVGRLLAKHAADPAHLPESAEAVLYDVSGLDASPWLAAAHAPSSPSTSDVGSTAMGSRAPSFASLSSAGSDGRRSVATAASGPRLHAHYQAPSVIPHHRFSSTASHQSADSGIAASHDVIYAPLMRKPVRSSPPASLEKKRNDWSISAVQLG